MRTHQREILIYYNPESSSDRKTLAHAKSVAPHLKSYAFDRAPSTTTSWQMILSSLNVNPKELLNKAHPYYQKNIRGKEFGKDDMMNCIIHNPGMIKAPIAVRGQRAILCANPTDIYRLI